MKTIQYARPAVNVVRKRPLAKACAVALALGSVAAAPDGCNGYNNVSVEDNNLDPVSVSAQDSTQNAPAIVMRDNPQLTGSFEVHGADVAGDANGTMLAHGKWTKLTGLISMNEIKSNGVTLETQYGPLLPAEDFQGPGFLKWGSRFGSLVHGNTYKLDMSAEAGASKEHILSQRSLYVKLSDKVKLVPVVVINWKKPGSDPTFVDHTHIAKNMFDFIPYHKPRHMNSQLTLQQVNNPNQPSVNITSPDAYEYPPDDIYAQCHTKYGIDPVQFQVVATFTFDLPAGHVPNCGTWTTTFPGLNDIRNRIKAAWGAMGTTLVDTLQPVYVAYGDMGSCSGWQGYTGKVVGGMPLAEINFGRTRITTAHELGHVLGLPHKTLNGAPHSGNLMRENPSSSDKDLTDVQCNSLKTAAANYSTRFKTFNEKTGRLYKAVQLPSDGPIVVDMPDGPIQVSTQCCNVNGAYSRVLSGSCQGSVVSNAYCETCCKVGTDAEVVWKDECAAADVLASNQCTSICCSTNPNSYMTAYKCQAQGGTPVQCPPPEPPH